MCASPRSWLHVTILDPRSHTIIAEADGHLAGLPGPFGARHEPPLGVLHEGIAALQRSLGIVGRKREPQPLEVAYPTTRPGALGGRGVGLSPQHQQVTLRAGSAVLDPPAPRSPQFPELLVKLGTVPSDVLVRGAGKGGDAPRTLEHCAVSAAAQPPCRR